MKNEITKFDYNQIDNKTANFLFQKEMNMHEIIEKAYTELNRELDEAQQRLTGSRYDEIFVQWCHSLEDSLPIFPIFTFHNNEKRYEFRIGGKNRNDILSEKIEMLEQEIETLKETIEDAHAELCENNWDSSQKAINILGKKLS